MKKKKGLFVGLALLSTFLFLSGNWVVSAAGISGAIYTTDGRCSGVNVNSFSSKYDIYLNGGPTSGGGSGLPDGNYYARVTDTNGNAVLGKTLTPSVSVSGGKFAVCYRLMDILYSSSSGFTLKGFDDSSNGQYKVWASKDITFPNDGSKTDNFSVNSAPATAIPTSTPTATSTAVPASTATIANATAPDSTPTTTSTATDANKTVPDSTPTTSDPVKTSTSTPQLPPEPLPTASAPTQAVAQPTETVQVPAPALPSPSTPPVLPSPTPIAPVVWPSKLPNAGEIPFDGTELTVLGMIFGALGAITRRLAR